MNELKAFLGGVVYLFACLFTVVLLLCGTAVLWVIFRILVGMK